MLVNAGAIAQAQPAPTLGDVKSAVEQQANQKKHAAKDAVQADKAKAQHAVADEKHKAQDMVESKNSKANAKAAEQEQRAKDLAAEKKGEGRIDGDGTATKGYGQGAEPCRPDHAERIR